VLCGIIFFFFASASQFFFFLSLSLSLSLSLLSFLSLYITGHHQAMRKKQISETPVYDKALKA
jgi:hypothetical protein